MILYDETIRQRSHDGTPLVDLLPPQHIMAGIKVDRERSRWPAAPMSW